MMRVYVILVGLMLALGTSAAGLAQTISGVHGPSVRADDRSVMYRVAFTPEEDGREADTAHRLHYQHAVNDSHRWRVLFNASDNGNGLLDPDSLQAEWLWQFIEKTETNQLWQSGLRFDYRHYLRDGRADRLRLNWTNQWDLANGWRVRALSQNWVEVGDGSRDGVWMEVRGSLTRKVSDNVRLGVESFNGLGNLDDVPDFDDQNHRLGPVISVSHGNGWSTQTRVLFGVSDRASDADFGFWVNRAL